MNLVKCVIAIILIILGGMTTYCSKGIEDYKHIIFVIIILLSSILAIWDYVKELLENKEGIKKLKDYSNQTKVKNNSIIPGINKHVERDEIASVYDALNHKKRILLIGDAGVGKTGIVVDISNETKNVNFLFFDLRDFANCNCMEEVAEIIGMNGYNIIDLIKILAKKKTTVIVLDQCDSIWRKTNSVDILLKIIKNIADVENLGMVVVCRKQESVGLKKEISRPPKVEAIEVEIDLLSKEKTEQVLLSFGITHPSEQLTGIAQNLFNLSILGEMYQKVSVQEMSSITNLLDFWERYRIILENELSNNPNNCGVTIHAAKLSKECILNPHGCCNVNATPIDEEKVLISWGVIKKETQLDLRYRFRHENMRDYMYCYDAIGIRGVMDFSQIETELGEQAGLITPVYLQMVERIQPDRIADLITKVLGNEQ